MTSRSAYNPLDLFSLDPARMQKALHALLAAPQNNLALFVSGVPAATWLQQHHDARDAQPVDGPAVLQQCLSLAWGHLEHKSKPLQKLLVEQVQAALVHSGKANLLCCREASWPASSESLWPFHSSSCIVWRSIWHIPGHALVSPAPAAGGTCPVLSGTGPCSIWPGIVFSLSGLCSQRLDAEGAADSCCHHLLASAGVLPRLLEAQQLDRWDISNTYPLLQHLLGQPLERTTPTALLLCKLHIREQLAVLADYLTAAAAKDCSLMITLRPYAGDTQIKFWSQLCVVDLDLKPLCKLHEHNELDLLILKHAASLQCRNLDEPNAASGF